MVAGVMSTAFDLTIETATLLGAENPRVLPYHLMKIKIKMSVG